MSKSSESQRGLYIVTGFLGSGKTTLLRGILQHREHDSSFVIVNEFSDMGLDQEVIDAHKAQILLIDGGCVCCTHQHELIMALTSNINEEFSGSRPHSSHTIIETSGVSDPAPILQAILQHPVLQHHYRHIRIITLVDAVNALSTMPFHPASHKQIAVADHILVTKSDLVSESALLRLEHFLSELAPSTHITVAPINVSTSEVLHLFSPLSPFNEPPLRAGNQLLLAKRNSGVLETIEPPSQDIGGADGNKLESLSLAFEKPLNWTVFGIWLSALLHRHGSEVLRVKALIDVGAPGPVVLNGVQGLIHPPIHLSRWPNGHASSRIVFVARGEYLKSIERSLLAFQAALTMDSG